MKAYVLLAVLFATQGMAQPQQVHLSTGEYPPYIVHRDGALTGLYVEIIRQAFATQNITPQITLKPWSKAYQASSTGKVDGTFSWFYSTQRASKHLYTAPLHKESMVWVHHQATPFNWETASDIQGYALLAVKGYTLTTQLEGWKSKGLIALSLVDTSDKALSYLVERKAALYLENRDHIDYLLQQNPAMPISYHPRAYTEQESYLLFSKKISKSKLLVKMFNQGLTQIKNTGQYNKLVTQWQKPSLVSP